jgi:hypothetical protein
MYPVGNGLAHKIFGKNMWVSYTLENINSEGETIITGAYNNIRVDVRVPKSYECETEIMTYYGELLVASTLSLNKGIKIDKYWIENYFDQIIVNNVIGMDRKEEEVKDKDYPEFKAKLSSSMVFRMLMFIAALSSIRRTPFSFHYKKYSIIIATTKVISSINYYICAMKNGVKIAEGSYCSSNEIFNVDVLRKLIKSILKNYSQKKSIG